MKFKILRFIHRSRIIYRLKISDLSLIMIILISM